MNEFTLVIDYIFNLCVQIWITINSHWLMQLMLALIVIGVIIDLTVQTTPKQ